MDLTRLITRWRAETGPLIVQAATLHAVAAELARLDRGRELLRDGMAVAALQVLDESDPPAFVTGDPIRADQLEIGDRFRYSGGQVPPFAEDQVWTVTESHWTDREVMSWWRVVAVHEDAIARAQRAGDYAPGHTFVFVDRDGA